MKSAGRSLLLLAAIPLSAQNYEAGLIFGQQKYDSFVEYGRFQINGSAPDTNRVVAARFGVSVFDFGPARMLLTLGYQPERPTTIQRPTYQPYSNNFKYSYFSLGAGIAMKSTVALSASLEVRSENLKEVNGNSGGTITSRSTWERGWLRLNLSYEFPGAGIKPFIGLEAASALWTQKMQLLDYLNSPDDRVRAIAPKSQIGLYVGVRF